MKNSNDHESLIAHNTSLITHEESGVKQRVPKLLLEYSMRQLHNELIASPDDAGLFGAWHDDTNYVIFSETKFCSLEPPKLFPMTYHHKIVCGCAICNTSNYSQESLNAWWRKQLKTMKNKADNSRVRKTYELTQAYKSYAEYTFPNNETCHPRCENVAGSILSTPTNDGCQLPNWKCVLRKFTACTSIVFP